MTRSRWVDALEREAASLAVYAASHAQRDAAYLRRAAQIVTSERDARLVLSVLGYDDCAVERVLRDCDCEVPR